VRQGEPAFPRRKRRETFLGGHVRRADGAGIVLRRRRELDPESVDDHTAAGWGALLWRNFFNPGVPGVGNQGMAAPGCGLTRRGHRPISAARQQADCVRPLKEPPRSANKSRNRLLATELDEELSSLFSEKASTSTSAASKSEPGGTRAWDEALCRRAVGGFHENPLHLICGRLLGKLRVEEDRDKWSAESQNLQIASVQNGEHGLPDINSAFSDIFVPLALKSR